MRHLHQFSLIACNWKGKLAFLAKGWKERIRQRRKEGRGGNREICLFWVSLGSKLSISPRKSPKPKHGKTLLAVSSTKDKLHSIHTLSNITERQTRQDSYVFLKTYLRVSLSFSLSLFFFFCCKQSFLHKTFSESEYQCVCTTLIISYSSLEIRKCYSILESKEKILTDKMVKQGLITIYFWPFNAFCS